MPVLSISISVIAVLLILVCQSGCKDHDKSETLRLGGQHLDGYVTAKCLPFPDWYWSTRLIIQSTIVISKARTSDFLMTVICRSLSILFGQICF